MKYPNGTYMLAGYMPVVPAGKCKCGKKEFKAMRPGVWQTSTRSQDGVLHMRGRCKAA